MPTRLWDPRLFRPQRLRTFLVLFALALVIPLVAQAVFALNQMARTEQAEIERRVMQTAREVTAHIDRELERAFVTLETLATSDALKRGDLRSFHAQALLALKPSDKAAIVLLNREYGQLLDTLRDFGVALPPTADPATAQKVIDTKKRQVSNMFRGSISGRPVFNVEVPVLDEAQDVRYVLVMSFQASHIADVLKYANLGEPWITGVTDNNGIILARSERHEEFVGRPLPPELFEQSKSAKGVFRAVNVAGDPILRATVRSDHSAWFVSATVPLSQVEAPLTRSRLFAVTLLFTALVLGVVLAYVFGSFMTRPLATATQVAAAIGEESKHVPLSPLAEANILIETLQNASAELKRRQEHAEFLMRELAHRAKNQLATVRGMALQTARDSVTLEEFVAQFTQRIQGLARSQDVLVQQNWQGAWLDDLVHAQLDLFGASKRADVKGPTLFLEANAVQNLGFALHELATNASKYGSLSVTDGALKVHWEWTAENHVGFVWLEEDGPAVTAPLRKGFGHRVIMELVPRGMRGKATIEFRPNGLRWCIEFPGDHAINPSNAHAAT
jgi:two-component sensor histidine kinase